MSEFFKGAISKGKNFISKGKNMITAGISAGVMAVASTVSSFATDGTVDTVTTALTTGLSDTAKTIMLCVAAIIPIGLGIFGAKKAIEWAKKFFNKISN